MATGQAGHDVRHLHDFLLERAEPGLDGRRQMRNLAEFGVLRPVAKTTAWPWPERTVVPANAKFAMSSGWPSVMVQPSAVAVSIHR